VPVRTRIPQSKWVQRSISGKDQAAIRCQKNILFTLSTSYFRCKILDKFLLLHPILISGKKYSVSPWSRKLKIAKHWARESTVAADNSGRDYHLIS